MEIPNNEKPLEMIEIEKFINYKLKRWFKSSEKRMLSGTFKEKGSNEIIKNDDFMAYELQKGNAFDSYKCYIKYFNYTKRPHEIERIPISAKWVVTNSQTKSKEKE